MGLFNDLGSTGAGISKNERKKKGFFYFFEVLFAKFFKLIKANILYFLVSIPYLIVALFFIAPMLSQATGLDELMMNIEETEMAKSIIYTIMACAIFNFFGSGPASAGYAFVTRCFTRREYTWVASDGWDKFKENFKNGMLLFVVDMVVIYIILNSVIFYNFMIANGGDNQQIFFLFIKYFLLVVLYVYMISHIFAYQIMVTYECEFKDMLKTSVIMGMANLPMCTLLVIITGAIFMLLSSLGFLSVFVHAIIGITFTRFPLEFFATRVIDKNINMVKKQSAIRESENESDMGSK